MVGGRGKLPDQPRDAGWYPDPWSATGEGERYFDGKRWGTNERPLGRHTTTTIEPTRRGRVGSGGDRRTLTGIVIVVALIAGLWWLNHSHDSKPRGPETLPLASVRPTVPVATDRPPPIAEAPQPLGVPAPVPGGAGKYEILRDQPGAPDTPVAFDPCRAIHYVVNVTGAPSDGLTLIHDAFARLQTATGLHFIADGTTTETPNKDRVPYQPVRYDKNGWAPVLIAWRQESNFPELAGYIAGATSPRAALTPDNEHLEYVTGQVVFDREQLSVAKVPHRAEVRSIMLHEFGHLVGLAHTSDKTELMYSEVQSNLRDYGPGDLRGLALLGTQKCFPEG